MLSIFKKITFGLLFTFLFPFIADAEPVKAFSGDKAKFLNELNNFIAETNEEEATNLLSEMKAIWPMAEVDPKQEDKIYKAANKVFLRRMSKAKAISEFTYSANTGKLNDYQISMIISMCNKMLKVRMKAIPDFKAYLTSIIGFFVTYQTEDSFDAWSIATNKLINDNKRHFTKFLNSCNNIFIYNAIYVTPNLRWYGTSSKFSFDYDSLPKVIFPEMDIYCVAKNDTARIYRTNGSFYPTSGFWKGKGGKVFWTRAGIDTSVSYAELGTYEIKLKSSNYVADSVKYKNEKYFSDILYGQLKEKLLANVNEKNASYPRFISYTESMKIIEIEDSVDYEGGFMIKGNRFIGKSIGDRSAKVTFKRNNKPFLIAKSKSFTINKERIATNNASVTMILDTDSIYHPALQFKFNPSKRELTLYREEKGIGASPYSNTFHQMDMFIEWAKWDIDKQHIDFLTIPGSSSGKMSLESGSYYSEKRFISLQGLSDTHPLYILKQFILKKNDGDRNFTDFEIAGHFRKDIESIKRLMVNLASQGFVIYNIEEGLITVKDRLFDYMNAKSRKGDYDNIEITSQIKGEPNATMDLINFDITVRGVRGVALSRARKTGFMPANGVLKLHKNRDMSFAGIIRSGRYEFHGEKFSFSYDNFDVKLNEVDSVRLQAAYLAGETRGKKVQYKMVRSAIEDLSGALEIDWPHNKSGILSDSFPEFPKFHSTKKSYVKYNKRNKRGRVYDPDKFYFQLDTFTVDSMMSFSVPGISFPGTFTSGGIFPEFREKLVLMPDHSLGFVKTAPEEGYKVYGGKARFDNDIVLSNEGLMGDGEFHYITSTSKSKAFVFYLDSMKALAYESEIRPQLVPVEYCDVQGEKVKVAYYTKKDYLKMDKVKTPIVMYSKGAKLSGGLKYDHNGMSGAGIMDFDNAELKSKIFEFQNMTFNADTSDFKLKSDTTDLDLASVNDPGNGIAFSTNDVNSKIDFNKRVGEFVANGGASFVDFPMNSYICFMDQFKWFMDNFSLELSSSDDNAVKGTSTAGGNDLDLAGSEFISTHADQDSLKFISPKANYDLKDYVIKAHDVKYINVADARVYPSDGEVVVKRAAELVPLIGAEIIANITTQYHTITNSTVNIKARRRYYAEGDYEYISANGGKQLVHFNNIRVDSAYQTVASGNIKVKDKFMLSPDFGYRGSTRIEANKKGMLFRGAAKLQHACNKLNKPWFGFESEIDPLNVMIPIDSGIQSWVKGKAKGTKLGTGVVIKRDSTHLYSSFLSKKKYHSDKMLITAAGFVKYDSKLKEYQLSNKEKLMESSFPGNFIGLNTKTCMVRGEGEIILGDKLGQIKVNNFGSVTHDPSSDSVKINGAMSVDFHLDDAMWSHMLGNIQGNPKLRPTEISNSMYDKAIREMVGKKMGDKLVSELNLYGAFKKVPSEIRHNILFSDVNLHWQQRTKSYISNGDLGIGLLGKKQLNRFVKGNIQIVRKKGKEAFTIYIEIDEETWYYFSYSKGVMRCLSSSEDFNAIISSIKADDREVKGEKGEGPYTFMLGTERSKRKFLLKVTN